MWQVGLRICWLTQGLPTLSWSLTPEPFPPKPVPFWVLQENQLQKYSPKHFFDAGMGKYFPTSFWWSLSILFPYWEWIFPCLWNLAAISVLMEDALKLSFGSKLFLQPRSETIPEWKSPFMDVQSKNPQISSSADGKIQAWLYPLVKFTIQPPFCLPPRALSPFTLA